MEVNHLTTNSTVHLLQTGISNRVEPLLSGHPKYKELVVAYGSAHLRELNCRKSLTRRSPDTCIFWRECFACNF